MKIHIDQLTLLACKELIKAPWIWLGTRSFTFWYHAFLQCDWTRLIVSLASLKCEELGFAFSVLGLITIVVNFCKSVVSNSWWRFPAKAGCKHFQVSNHQQLRALIFLLFNFIHVVMT